MPSKHKNIGQMFKDNILRICFWGSSAIGVVGLGAAGQNLMNGKPEDAKAGGKVALWAGIADVICLGAAALTGKKLNLRAGKDVSFDEINDQKKKTPGGPGVQ